MKSSDIFNSRAGLFSHSPTCINNVDVELLYFSDITRLIDRKTVSDQQVVENGKLVTLMDRSEQAVFPLPLELHSHKVPTRKKGKGGYHAF